MNEVRVPSCDRGDRITWAGMGVAAFALCLALTRHDLAQPHPSILIVVCGVVGMLVLVFWLFLQASKWVGITDDALVQYYFGRPVCRVRFDEIERAVLCAWGMRRGARAGGPYLVLTVKTKKGLTISFDGQKELAEPYFRNIAERFSTQASPGAAVLNVTIRESGSKSRKHRDGRERHH